MNDVAVSIGSNIDPHKNIKRAIDLLTSEHAVRAVSSFIQTKPIGFTEQPDFINGSILISTALSIEQFSTCLKDTEKRLGRKKSINKFGPRTIDLDIVVWNMKIVNIDFFERDFLRKSILELLPGADLL
jgi:2-amino-4-hydroxy-6-hydroxymethyldihydropteridine diphosphokinase